MCREIRVLLLGQYEDVRELCLVGRGVVELSPSSLINCAAGCIVGSANRWAGTRGLVGATIGLWLRDDLCGSSLGVRRRVRLLPGELEGRDCCTGSGGENNR